MGMLSYSPRRLTSSIDQLDEELCMVYRAELERWAQEEVPANSLKQMAMPMSTLVRKGR